MKFVVRAPSNIALIKYMGKKDEKDRIPFNPSLSLTLNDFFTEARFDVSQSPQPELIPTGNLTEKAVARVHGHLDRLMTKELPVFCSKWDLPFEPERKVTWSSSNNFPSSVGIASSAASFAAVSLGWVASFSDPRACHDRLKDQAFQSDLSTLARVGSGSASRSVAGPWMSWEGERARLESDLPGDWTDLLILVSTEPKKVGSSTAHQRVLTSPLWEGRAKRAEKRLGELRNALISRDRAAASQISWSEFWDMHSLFHTSQEPFSYISEETKEVLDYLEPLVGKANSPLVTMDAGPNVHLLVPDNESERWQNEIKEKFSRYEVLVSKAGQGITLELSDVSS